MEQTGFFQDHDPLVNDHLPDGGLRIKIIGIGGAGTNAVDRIKLEDLEQVHLTVIDTDSQVLSASPVEESFLLGRTVTKGKSAGGSVDRGRAAAESDVDALREIVRGVDLVFLLAGLGGGTGSGATPVIAELAASEGALVIAFTPMPFQREGSGRCDRAKKALEALQKRCHAVISLPNDLIFKQVDETATLMEAFAMADKWIKLGVHSIWSMLFSTGLINIDFSTLQSALAEPGGKTIFGTGYGKGDDFIDQALSDLENCPLLHLPEAGFKESDQLILNLTGGPDLTMGMVNKAMDAVGEKFNCRNSMVMGASIDGSFYNQLRITIMGTTRNPVLKGFAPVPAASIPPNQPVAPPLKPADTFDAAEKAAVAAKRTQDEFPFPTQEENRGLFEKTQRNLYEGIDLDIPTYLRRGIKITRA
jgi:cell division protein FtsZ